MNFITMERWPVIDLDERHHDLAKNFRLTRSRLGYFLFAARSRCSCAVFRS
jgi:hypothetical protein